MSNVFGFVPEIGLISKKLLAGYVTIDTEQTITADKTFNSNLLCNQSITATNYAFANGTIQTTAYKSLPLGTYRNCSITVDGFGAISSVTTGITYTPGTYTNSTITVNALGQISAVESGVGPAGSFVTTDTVQTITAQKTFTAPVEFSAAGNVRFNAPVQFSYGGDFSTPYTFPALGPIASFYTFSPTAAMQFNIPEPSAALAGTRVLFKRAGGTTNTIVTWRTLNNTFSFIAFNGVTLANSVSISTQNQTELLYLSDKILQFNLT